MRAEMNIYGIAIIKLAQRTLIMIAICNDLLTASLLMHYFLFNDNYACK